MAERNRTIDSLKGFAIILVVLGHVIQTIYSPNEYDKNFVFKIIYSFHMPLFIFISGYLIGNRDKLDLQWLKGRFLRLGVPFWLWVLLDYVICGGRSGAELEKAYQRVFYDPSNQGLWFLWVLFLFCIFLYVNVNIIERVLNILHKPRFQTFEVWMMELFLTLFLLICLCGVWALTGFTTILGYRLCCKEIVFFLLGYYISKYKQDSTSCIDNWRMELLFYVLYPICVFAWDRTHLVIFYDDLMRFAGDNIVLKIVVLGLAAIYFYFVSFLGIGFVWKLFVHINNRFHLWVLPQIGMYTMEIYILHRYFFTTFFEKRWLDSAISLCLGVLFPLIVGMLISKNKFMSRILFGK